MGVKFGEIDSMQILHNEFNIGILQKLIEGLMASNPSLVKPNQTQMEEIKRSVAEELAKKYPNSGIEYKG